MGTARCQRWAGFVKAATVWVKVDGCGWSAGTVGSTIGRPPALGPATDGRGCTRAARVRRGSLWPTLRGAVDATCNCIARGVSCESTLG